MRTKITWVLATYFTNKGFLAVLAFSGLCFGAVIAQSLFGVMPGTLIPRSPWAFGFATAISAMGVGGIVARQFRNPASYLSPNFVRAHVIASLLWLGIIGAGALICTSMARQPFLPGLLFSLGMTGCLFSAGVNLASQGQPSPTMESNLRDKLLGLGLLTIVPLLLLPGSWLTNVLLVPGLLLAGTGNAWRACQTLRSLAGATATIGIAPGHAATSIQHRSLLVEDAFESFLESWRSSAHQSTLWNRVLRWRAGNPRIAAVLMIVSGSIVFAVFPWFFMPVTPPADRPTPPLGIYAAATLLVTSVSIAYAWRKRLMCLDVESLWPMWRRSLQWEWAASLASDLLPPALTAGAIVTLSLQLQDEWFSTIAWQALIAGWGEALSMLVVLSGALWLTTLAFASIVVVIERAWLGLTVAFGTFLLGGMPFGAMLGDLTRQTRHAPELSAAIPLLLIPVTVSAVAIICMWRLWTRIDIDRRA